MAGAPCVASSKKICIASRPLEATSRKRLSRHRHHQLSLGLWGVPSSGFPNKHTYGVRVRGFARCRGERHTYRDLTFFDYFSTISTNLLLLPTNLDVSLTIDKKQGRLKVDSRVTRRFNFIADALGAPTMSGQATVQKDEKRTSIKNNDKDVKTLRTQRFFAHAETRKMNRVEHTLMQREQNSGYMETLAIEMGPQTSAENTKDENQFTLAICAPNDSENAGSSERKEDETGRAVDTCEESKTPRVIDNSQIVENMWKPIEWDVEFFREAFAIVLDFIKCAECGSEKLQRAGVANNTYRVRCSTCNRSFSGMNDAYASFFEENFDEMLECSPTVIGRYERTRPNRERGATIKPGSRSEKSAEQKTVETDDEMNGDADMPPRQRRNLKLSKSVFSKMLDWKSLPGVVVSDKTISEVLVFLNEIVAQSDEKTSALLSTGLKRLIDALDADFRATSELSKKNMQNVHEKGPVNQAHASRPSGAQKQSQMTQQKQADQQQRKESSAQESAPSSPRTFADAARANAPETEEWTTITKDGRRKTIQVPVGGVPQPPRTAPKWKSTEVTEEMSRRFWEEGKKPMRNELVFLYVRGMPRDHYWRIRAMLANKGLDSNWFRELAFMHDGMLEMLVHEERAAEIMDKLNGLGKKTSRDVEEIDVNKEGSTAYLEAMRRRVKKRLESVNSKAKGVIYHLKSKLRQLEDELRLRSERLNGTMTQ
jgi:hypothetical protein